MIQQNTTINWSEADFVINRFRFPCITEACLLLCIIRPHFTWLRRDQIQEAWEAMRIDMGKAWPCPYWVSLGLRSHIPKNLIGQQKDVSFSCLKCQGEDQSSHFGIWWNLFRGSTEPLQAQDWKCMGTPHYSGFESQSKLCWADWRVPILEDSQGTELTYWHTMSIKKQPLDHDP